MNKMPRIWCDYCSILVRLQKGSQTRRTFDRAMQALPITQHEVVWGLYIKWINSFGIPRTSISVWKRYLMYDPLKKESCIESFLDIEQHVEAAKQLYECIQNENYVSPNGKTKHELTMEICDLVANHPEGMSKEMDVESIIRGGISKYSDEVGKLWCKLADYKVRLGDFEAARNIYEEGISVIKTARDFGIIFDAYIKVEESVLMAKMKIDSEDSDIEVRLSHLEQLLANRALLLNAVILRQNPNNVHEWLKRIKMHDDESLEKLASMKKAIDTVDPLLANGHTSILHMRLANYYEENNKLEEARKAWKDALKINFKSADELASVYCAYAEMEMRCEMYDDALKIMQQAITEPASSIKRRKALAASQGRGETRDGVFEGAVSADRLYKNLKAWSLYLDLEESMGTVESCRAAYDRAMELKVLTGQMCLNYASYLEEHNFFEDSFRIYERSVAIFDFPVVKNVWLTYLDKFTERYEGTKLERLRDLYEQAIESAPPIDAVELLIKYAKTEEKYGLARHYLSIYERATRAAPEPNRLDMYRLYIKKVESVHGITKSRPIYQKAIGELSDVSAMNLCLEFAEVEKNLGEIDRSRAIFSHGSQFSNPRRERTYWQKWREFEETYGNEDTFRDMLRIQRSIETKFSQVSYAASDALSQKNDTSNDGNSLKRKFVTSQSEEGAGAAATTSNSIEDLEQHAIAKKKHASSLKHASEEIDIDNGQVAILAVPKAVFGSAADN